MSDDQLDNDLRNRIKQVFDNYEDNTAEEGWLLLREKYPEKEKDRVVIWLWRIAGAAAILMFFLGLGLWLNYHPIDKQNIAQHTKKVKNTDTTTTLKTATKTAVATTNTQQQATDTGLVAHTQYAQTHTTQPLNKTVAGQSVAQAKANKVYQQKYVAASSQGVAAKTVLAPASVKQHSRLPNALISSKGGTKSILLTSSGVKQPYQPNNLGNLPFQKPVDSITQSTFASQLTQKEKSLGIIDSSAIANNKTPIKQGPVRTAVSPIVKPQQPVIATSQISKNMQSLFEQETRTSGAQKTEEQKIIDKRVAFGIYAATYVNYAKGSNKQFNTGAGITADIKLTENLSILTGVSIAQNTLNYNTTTTSASSFPGVLLAESSHNFQPASNALPLLIPSSKDFNANLVGLEIPVDLKYVLNPTKGNTYFAAGLSSGTFINETYTTSYNYSATDNSNSQQTQDATHKAFDNFYLAKMFNVSFGVGYPVGKNQLIIEPFFKYPLNGLGDQHILFGSGGLNLKFNFDPPKKK